MRSPSEHTARSTLRRVVQAQAAATVALGLLLSAQPALGALLTDKPYTLGLVASVALLAVGVGALRAARHPAWRGRAPARSAQG